MLGRELAELIQGGGHPVVTFLPAVADKESYLEGGMRGRLVAVSNRHDGMFQLHVDLSEFDDFNRQFESADYFDKNRKPCLTAREAGVYKEPKEAFYVDDDLEVDFCKIEEDSRLQMYQEFSQTKDGRAYTQWLEDALVQARAAQVAIVLKPIDTAPMGKEVLLYWKDSKHMENGKMYDDGDSETGLYHVLFDGESLNCMPTHWAELPVFSR